MHAMTLRLDDRTSKRLDRVCRKKGYKKTGVIKSLIDDFLAAEEKPFVIPMRAKDYKPATIYNLSKLCGIVSLGGDSVEDTEDYWE